MIPLSRFDRAFRHAVRVRVFTVGNLPAVEKKPAERSTAPVNVACAGRAMNESVDDGADHGGR